MARMKRDLRIRKANDEVIEKRKPVRKARVRRPVAKKWDMTPAQRRAATPMPQRSNLTKREWQEWGDGLMVLRFNDFAGASTLSLNEMRDALRGIHLCANMRAIAHHRA